MHAAAFVRPDVELGAEAVDLRAEAGDVLRVGRAGEHLRHARGCRGALGQHLLDRVATAGRRLRLRARPSRSRLKNSISASSPKICFSSCRNDSRVCPGTIRASHCASATDGITLICEPACRIVAETVLCVIACSCRLRLSGMSSSASAASHCRGSSSARNRLRVGSACPAAMPSMYARAVALKCSGRRRSRRRRELFRERDDGVVVALQRSVPRRAAGAQIESAARLSRRSARGSS